MLKYNSCRPGNIILFKGEHLVEVLFCSKENVGFIDPTSSKEIFCLLDSDYVSGVPITEQLIVNKLYWITYEGPDYSGKTTIKELTDGRIIIRFNPESVAVFQPNNFPWAESIRLYMDFITSMAYLHELQNIYLDLFKEEMDVGGLIAN